MSAHRYWRTSRWQLGRYVPTAPAHVPYIRHWVPLPPGVEHLGFPRGAESATYFGGGEAVTFVRACKEGSRPAFRVYVCNSTAKFGDMSQLIFQEADEWNVKSWRAAAKVAPDVMATLSARVPYEITHLSVTPDLKTLYVRTKL